MTDTATVDGMEQLDPRSETAIAKHYLDLVTAPKKVTKGRRTAEWLRNRIDEIHGKLGESGLGGLERVKLIQERMECEADLDTSAETAALEEAQKRFVEIGAAWSARTGISYAALREAGVPAAVLREAGIKRG